MDLLAQIRAASKPDELRRIEVPEWGDESGPLVFFHKMVTLEDMSAAQTVSRDPFRQHVEIIVMKAVDEKGEKIFAKRMDAVELMEIAEPIVILRIAKKMGLLEQIETAAKN
jgi:hypothetical protein